jgi:hypothetical protein
MEWFRVGGSFRDVWILEDGNDVWVIIQVTKPECHPVHHIRTRCALLQYSGGKLALWLTPDHERNSCHLLDFLIDLSSLSDSFVKCQVENQNNVC